LKSLSHQDGEDIVVYLGLECFILMLDVTIEAKISTYKIKRFFVQFLCFFCGIAHNLRLLQQN